MRYAKAQEMASRVGWRIGIEERHTKGIVDWVFFVQGTSPERIWLCTFTNLYKMSKSDFAHALSQLPDGCAIAGCNRKDLRRYETSEGNQEWLCYAHFVALSLLKAHDRILFVAQEQAS